jgi:hypothetical protein
MTAKQAAWAEDLGAALEAGGLTWGGELAVEEMPRRREGCHVYIPSLLHCI